MSWMDWQLFFDWVPVFGLAGLILASCSSGRPVQKLGPCQRKRVAYPFSSCWKRNPCKVYILFSAKGLIDYSLLNILKELQYVYLMNLSWCLQSKQKGQKALKLPCLQSRLGFSVWAEWMCSVTVFVLASLTICLLLNMISQKTGTLLK